MDPLEIPEDLAALDDAALADFLTKALAEARTYDDVPDTEFDDEKLARLQALADAATAARDLAGQRETAAAERAERIATARAALVAPEPAPEAAAAEVVAAEPAEKAEEKVSVAAAVRRAPVVARAAAATSHTDTIVLDTEKPKVKLFASADVPGYTTGGELDSLDTVVQAVTARMRSLPTQRLGGDKGVQHRYATARLDFSSARTDGLTSEAFHGDDMAMLAAASKESRLPNGSLTAAGGWCAPSEVLYDLCTLESTDGLLTLPSTQWSRGGIRFTKGPSFQDIYNSEGLGWWLTEAQVIAGTTKPCVTVECPDFDEERLDAVGLCVRLPLLTQAAYPELTRRWLEGILVAHQHIVDATIINRIAAGSHTADATGSFETTVDGLSKLEQIANYLRQQWRASFSTTFEILAPYWYKTVIRGDLARRFGQPFGQVTDAQITQYFANINLNVQWLYNYQPLTSSGTGDDVNVQTPDTVKVLVYPAGTWIKGTTDVINLDTVYDSQSLAENVFTALFTEEGIGLANTCFESYEIDLTTCASGRVGAADITSCLFGALQ